MIIDTVPTKGQIAFRTFFSSFFLAILFFGVIPCAALVLLLFVYGLVLAFGCILVSPFVGAVTGFLLMLLTLLWHYPLRNAHKYRLMVSIVSGSVYTLGGLISTAPFVLIAEGNPYHGIVLQQGAYLWNYIRLAYAQIIHGDIYNVPGGLLFGLLGIYVGRYTSKWYTTSSDQQIKDS